MLKVIVFSIVVFMTPESNCVEVNLIDTTKATTDLNWKTTPNDGTGWNELSNTDENQFLLRTFQVCRNTRNTERSNWLRTNYIKPNENVQSIYIEVKFTIRSCRNNLYRATCKETFNLYHVKTNSPYDENDMRVDDTSYTKIGTIAAAQTLPSGQHTTTTKTIKFENIGKRGFFLAFQDTGACMIIYYVRVFYKKCQETTNQLAYYPSTLTGPKITSLVKTTGKCVANSIPGERAKEPTQICDDEGQWTLPEGFCECLPGYQANGDMTKCIECPMGYYKSTVGSDRCVQCPENSVTFINGSQVCICREGYYRMFKDNPGDPCTPPTAKPEDIRYVVKNTSVFIHWSPPKNSYEKKHIYYSLSCAVCDSTYSVCSKCEDSIHYEPSGRYLVEPFVSVTSLTHQAYYRFRIYSYNRVSKIIGKLPMYSDITLRTGESVPLVKNVRAIEITKSEILLNWDKPQLQQVGMFEYEIYYKSKNGKISLSNKTTHESFRIRSLPPETSFIIQIRARDETGIGKFSEPVVIRTLRISIPILFKPAHKERNLETNITSLPSDVTVDYFYVFIIVSVTCVIVIIVAAIIFIKRRRNHETARCVDLKVYPYFDDTVDLLHAQKRPLPTLTPEKLNNPVNFIHEFTREIDVFNITRQSLIGSGEFGEVYVGALRPTSFIFDDTITKMTSYRSCHRSVAVKTFKFKETETSKKDFLEEAIIMSQFSHPNIVRLEGIVTKTSPLMLISEYVENGSLEKYLEYRRLRGIRVEMCQLVNMLRDVAKGMEYLTGMGFIHCDLAARNILVNEQLNCKISDFGMCKKLAKKQENSGIMGQAKREIIPVRWTAPEAISFRSYTTSSDVWSYGVVIWEVLTHGQRPYWEMLNSDVVLFVSSGYRLPPPTFCPSILHQLMMSCWRFDPNQRPNFYYIISQLENLLNQPETLQNTINNTFIQYQMLCTPESLDLTLLEQWLEDMNMTKYKSTMLSYGCVIADQIIKLNSEQLDIMGIVEKSNQNILLEGAEFLRQKLLEISNIGIGIEV